MKFSSSAGVNGIGVESLFSRFFEFWGSRSRENDGKTDLPPVGQSMTENPRLLTNFFFSIHVVLETLLPINDLLSKREEMK